MERRGAGEVIAVDLSDPGRQDSPAGRPAPAGPAAETRGAGFALAADALGSKASYLDRSVYALARGEVGEFDCVLLP